MSARQTRALAALEAALAARFTADAALMAMVTGRIHDGAPRAAIAPYLAFAEARAADFSSGDGEGTRASLVLEAVTGEEGRGRALAVLDRAMALALDETLVVEAASVVLIRLSTVSVQRLSAGRGWRAIATLEALVDG